jgi:rhodanese-related sulfurtransferase
MNKNIIKFIVLALTTSVIVSCNAIFENGDELAAAQQGQVEQITVDELNTKLEEGGDFYLIDVRQVDEFSQVSIPGSFNIPRGLLEFKINDYDYWEEEFFYEPEKDDEIIIYCQKGFRGVLAALTLKQLGFTNVKNLEGGIISWDPEIEKNAPTTKTGGGCGD